MKPGFALSIFFLNMQTSSKMHRLFENIVICCKILNSLKIFRFLYLNCEAKVI